MMLQLDPMIPVYVDNGRVKGEGFAFIVTRYSQEHHLLWTVTMDKTGEIWEVPNPEVRFVWNRSMQRRPVGEKGFDLEAWKESVRGLERP